LEWELFGPDAAEEVLWEIMWTPWIHGPQLRGLDIYFRVWDETVFEG
jgi:hypothetical protein